MRRFLIIILCFVTLGLSSCSSDEKPVDTETEEVSEEDRELIEQLGY
ncbi:MAG: hypothetical protein GY747_02240 [Planctomycetes bacterium]|nr:hypothetical protein [Planctomycetota bacterium]MCP4770684.1 hypothetical protein [Planctomycetota bacterium]